MGLVCYENKSKEFLFLPWKIKKKRSNNCIHKEIDDFMNLLDLCIFNY